MLSLVEYHSNLSTELFPDQQCDIAIVVRFLFPILSVLLYSELCSTLCVFDYDLLCPGNTLSTFVKIYEEPGSLFSFLHPSN